MVHISRAGEIYRMKRGLSAVKTASTNMKVVLALLKESCLAWLQDNAPSMSAALTFYAILSLIPVLIVATAVAGLGFWQKLAEAEALRQIQAVLGETSARVLQAAILSANRPALGAIASVIAVGTILVGASGAFIELQDALNKIWKVERKSEGILLGAMKQRFCHSAWSWARAFCCCCHSSRAPHWGLCRDSWAIFFVGLCFCWNRLISFFRSL